MKRSNRLVLLIGIFLAIVAFVLIVLMLGNGDGGGGIRPSASPTTGKCCGIGPVRPAIFRLLPMSTTTAVTRRLSGSH